MVASGAEPRRSPSTRAFVRIAEAAGLLMVSESTVRRRCRAGSLPAIRSGRQWRVELEALRQAMAGAPELRELRATVFDET